MVAAAPSQWGIPFHGDGFAEMLHIHTHFEDKGDQYYLQAVSEFNQFLEARHTGAPGC